MSLRIAPPVIDSLTPSWWMKKGDPKFTIEVIRFDGSYESAAAVIAMLTKTTVAELVIGEDDGKFSEFRFYEPDFSSPVDRDAVIIRLNSSEAASESAEFSYGNTWTRVSVEDFNYIGFVKLPFPPEVTTPEGMNFADSKREELGRKAEAERIEATATDAFFNGAYFSGRSFHHDHRERGEIYFDESR